MTQLFGDRGLPATYRHMNGYGSHAYGFWNKNAERFWVKFHVKTHQGIKCLTEEQAAKIAGESPDYHAQDLCSAIEDGDYPSWTQYVQVMPGSDADGCHLNPCDLAKIWPRAGVKPRMVMPRPVTCTRVDAWG